MSAFSDTAFSTDAFSINAFDFGSAVVVVVDTHDGEKQDRDFKKRHELLRAELEKAFEGRYGAPVQEELAEFIAPQITDSVARAPIERVDWNRVWQRYDEVVRRLEQAALKAEEDEEDAFLLLS